MDYILDIIIIVSLVLFLLIGLTKNYKRTLIELGFFAIIYCVFYFVVGKVVINSTSLDLGEEFNNSINQIINSLKEINKSITELNNSQEGLSFPLIPDQYLSSELYYGIVFSIANQIVFIAYAFVSFILSIILGSITYAIIFRKKNADPEYVKKKKSWKMRSIGMGVNFVFGVITTSLIMSPLVLTTNSVISASNELNKIVNNEKISTLLNKVNSYKTTVDDVSYKFDNIDGKLNTIVDTLSTYKDDLDNLNTDLTTFKNEFDGYYILINDIVDNPGKLNDEEIKASKEVLEKMEEYKTDLDSNVSSFNYSYSEFNDNYDSALESQNEMKSYKTKIEDIKSTINNINTDNMDTTEVKKLLEQVSEYVPTLKIFNFLIIDLNYSYITIEGTTYNYMNSLNEIFTFVNEYIDTLYNNITPYFEDIDQQVNTFNDKYDEVNTQLDDIQKQIDESDYDAKIDDVNGKIEDVKDKFQDAKDTIDELDERRK